LGPHAVAACRLGRACWAATEEGDPARRRSEAEEARGLTTGLTKAGTARSSATVAWKPKGDGMRSGGGGQDSSPAPEAAATAGVASRAWAPAKSLAARFLRRLCRPILAGLPT